MEQISFICLPPPPLSFSTSASLYLNVSHYLVVRKTCLMAYLSSSNRYWKIISVCLSHQMYIFVYVLATWTTTWVSGMLGPSCTDPDIFFISFSAHKELVVSVSIWGLFSVFPATISKKKNNAFKCHFSFPKWARKQAHWRAPSPMDSNDCIQLWHTQCWDVCPIHDYQWWEEELLSRPWDFDSSCWSRQWHINKHWAFSFCTNTILNYSLHQ